MVVYRPAGVETIHQKLGLLTLSILGPCSIEIKYLTHLCLLKQNKANTILSSQSHSRSSQCQPVNELQVDGASADNMQNRCSRNNSNLLSLLIKELFPWSLTLPLVISCVSCLCCFCPHCVCLKQQPPVDPRLWCSANSPPPRSLLSQPVGMIPF